MSRDDVVLGDSSCFTHIIDSVKIGGKRKPKSLKHRAKGASATTRQRKAPARKALATRGTVSPRDFDEYLATVPEPARKALVVMREAIRSVVPDEATEVISYNLPAFRHK